MDWIKCITNRLLHAGRQEAGVTLLETVFAIAIFAVVSASIIGVVTSATAADSNARQKSIALELAQQQVEYIRQLAYGNAATIGGNPAPPSGSGVQPTSSKRVMGLWYTLTTSIKYVNDPVPTSGVIATFANYKQVVVSVSRESDGAQLARVTTYLTNPSRQSLGGINNAIINVTTKDYGAPGQPNLGGVAINLSNTAVGYNANDTTDNTTGGPSFGQVTFPALQAGLGTYLTTATLSGYQTLREHLTTTVGSPAIAQVAASATQNETILLYKPCSIYVRVIDQTTGAPYIGQATVTIAYGDRNDSQTFTTTNGLVQIVPPATLDGEQPVPGAGYSVTVDTPDHRHGERTGLTVPDDYTAANPSSTFVVPLPAVPVPQNAKLTVTVNHASNLKTTDCSTGSAVNGATVTISSTDLTPPYSNTLSSNSSGQAVFTAIPLGTYNISVTKKDHGTTYRGGPTGLPVTTDTSVCVPLRY